VDATREVAAAAAAAVGGAMRKRKWCVLCHVFYSTFLGEASKIWEVGREQVWYVCMYRSDKYDVVMIPPTYRIPFFLECDIIYIRAHSSIKRPIVQLVRVKSLQTCGACSNQDACLRPCEPRQKNTVGENPVINFDW
jgi:hypothetical protein